MALGKQYAGMWTLSQQMQAISGRTWTGIPAVPSMWAWGRGQDGQLGINAVGFRSSPVQVDSNISWPRIAAVEFAGGIKGDGTLWMWGDGVSGHMGNNSEVRVLFTFALLVFSLLSNINIKQILSL